MYSTVTVYDSNWNGGMLPAQFMELWIPCDVYLIGVCCPRKNTLPKKKFDGNTTLFFWLKNKQLLCSMHCSYDLHITVWKWLWGFYPLYKVKSDHLHCKGDALEIIVTCPSIDHMYMFTLQTYRCSCSLWYGCFCAALDSDSLWYGCFCAALERDWLLGCSHPFLCSFKALCISSNISVYFCLLGR